MKGEDKGISGGKAKGRGRSRLRIAKGRALRGARVVTRGEAILPY